MICLAAVVEKHPAKAVEQDRSELHVQQQRHERPYRDKRVPAALAERHAEESGQHVRDLLDAGMGCERMTDSRAQFVDLGLHRQGAGLQTIPRAIVQDLEGGPQHADRAVRARI